MADFVYEASPNVIASLRAAAARYGASEAELAAIVRLEEWRAEEVDLHRLAPLAKLAGQPWRELFGF